MSIISAGGAVTGADVATPINPRDYFNTVLWTGNGSDPRNITGVGFAPDFVWGKSTSFAYNHRLYDIIRGAQKALLSNATNAETAADDTMTAFLSDGFTVKNSLNNNTDTYVAWNWKANGAGVSNTDGTITATVSANTDSGFSIVTYTGNGSAGATFGHGLGATPSMVIVKWRDGADDWCVYNENLTTSRSLWLNSTSAELSAGYFGFFWNNTDPTSTVVTLGSNGAVNGSSRTYVAYCFAEIADFSKIGSYTGNGSATGPSVTTDFEPTWLMIKRTDSTGDWIIHDSARDATNPRTEYLEPNTADVEATGNDVDFNSTSFQIKSTSATVNANGGTYIYMCIA